MKIALSTPIEGSSCPRMALSCVGLVGPGALTRLAAVKNPIVTAALKATGILTELVHRLVIERLLCVRSSCCERQASRQSASSGIHSPDIRENSRGPNG